MRANVGLSSQRLQCLPHLAHTAGPLPPTTGAAAQQHNNFDPSGKYKLKCEGKRGSPLSGLCGDSERGSNGPPVWPPAVWSRTQPYATLCPFAFHTYFVTCLPQALSWQSSAPLARVMG